MLPQVPPKNTVYTVREGDDGWPVYSLQAALNSARVYASGGWGRLERDGAFGPGTEKATQTFQSAYGLSADGVAGPKTQRKLIELLDSSAHQHITGLPSGLMRGWVEGEGANTLAAVNWSAPGGVDCGPVQYRVYGPPYNFDALLAAFQPLAAMQRAASDYLDRAAYFYYTPGVRKREDRAEFSKRLAVLAHNWPAGAYDIARDGTLSDPNGAAPWVADGVKFPDGEEVNTRWEWCQFYSMGREDFNGMIPKYVTTW